MPPEDRVRLQHMLEATETAIGVTKNRERPDLDQNHMLLFAVIRTMEVLGEAANRVSPETRARYPEIPWRAWEGDIGQPAYYRQVAQYDYEYTSKLERYYPTMTAPTFILWGEEDRWVDISDGRRPRDLIADVTLQSLPDAGHFSMLDTPNLFNQKLEAWLLAQVS